MCRGRQLIKREAYCHFTTRPAELEEKDYTLLTPEKEGSAPQRMPSHPGDKTWWKVFGKTQPTSELTSFPGGVREEAVPLEQWRAALLCISIHFPGVSNTMQMWNLTKKKSLAHNTRGCRGSYFKSKAPWNPCARWTSACRAQLQNNTTSMRSAKELVPISLPQWTTQILLLWICSVQMSCANFSEIIWWGGKTPFEKDSRQTKQRWQNRSL